VLGEFANYWDVEMRLVPMDGTHFHPSAEEGCEACDENVGVVAILDPPSTAYRPSGSCRIDRFG
jgi:glutamate/tyrosine decarboxylase-like PLP-dependent enzyme